MADKADKDGLFWHEKIFGLDKEKEENIESRRIEIQKLQKAYQSVFGTPEGQKVFWDLLDQTYMFYPFEQENAGSYKKEGRREMGLYLLACCGFTKDANGLASLARMLQGQIGRAPKEE